MHCENQTFSSAQTWDTPAFHRLHSASNVKSSKVVKFCLIFFHRLSVIDQFARLLLLLLHLGWVIIGFLLLPVRFCIWRNLALSYEQADNARHVRWLWVPNFSYLLKNLYLFPPCFEIAEPSVLKLERMRDQAGWVQGPCGTTHTSDGKVNWS